MQFCSRSPWKSPLSEWDARDRYDQSNDRQIRCLHSTLMHIRTPCLNCSKSTGDSYLSTNVILNMRELGLHSEPHHHIIHSVPRTKDDDAAPLVAEHEE